MPYIKQEHRLNFYNEARDLGERAQCAGDLNYIITLMLHSYLKKRGVKYSNVNEIVGALECCKLELYRKIAAPYEDLKIRENGDVAMLTEEELKGKTY